MDFNSFSSSTLVISLFFLLFFYSFLLHRNERRENSEPQTELRIEKDKRFANRLSNSRKETECTYIFFCICPFCNAYFISVAAFGILKLSIVFCIPLCCCCGCCCNLFFILNKMKWNKLNGTKRLDAFAMVSIKKKFFCWREEKEKFKPKKKILSSHRFFVIDSLSVSVSLYPHSEPSFRKKIDIFRLCISGCVLVFQFLLAQQYHNLRCYIIHIHSVHMANSIILAAFFFFFLLFNRIEFNSMVLLGLI